MYLSQGQVGSDGLVREHFCAPPPQREGEGAALLTNNFPLDLIRVGVNEWRGGTWKCYFFQVGA